MRLIDGDALIEQIEANICKPCKERKDDCNGVRCRACQYGDEIDDIEDAPTAGEWIPCSKRLPEETGYYLTTTMYREVYCDFWNGENFNRTEFVIAYMPFPKPYKEEEE